MTAPKTPDERTRREALAWQLCLRICDERRSIDELRVIEHVLSGLESGAESYGPLCVATDRRNWKAERADELRDALVYGACQAIAERDREVARIENDVAEAMFAP